MSEQKLLRISIEICQKLSVKSIRPISVSWRTYSGSPTLGRLLGLTMVPYDDCIFTQNQVILPLRSKGMLEPEEWAPIMASQVIYGQKLKSRRIKGVVMRVFPLILLYVGLPILLFEMGILNLGGETTLRGSPIPVAFAFFLLFAMSTIFVTVATYASIGHRYLRNLKLIADRESTAIFGPKAFASSLEKLGQTFPLLLVGKRPVPDYPHGRLSIRERIQNILSSDCKA